MTEYKYPNNILYDLFEHYLIDSTSLDSINIMKLKSYIKNDSVINKMTPTQRQNKLYIEHTLKNTDSDLNKSLSFLMDNAIKHLDKVRSQKILIWRYKENKTLKECGNIFNISSERVRQIQNFSINQLRINQLFSCINDLFWMNDYQKGLSQNISKQRLFTAAQAGYIPYLDENWHYLINYFNPRGNQNIDNYLKVLLNTRWKYVFNFLQIPYQSLRKELK